MIFFGHNVVCYSVATPVRSDSDIARCLQHNDIPEATRERSDSELARQLQDEWNAGEDNNISTGIPELMISSSRKSSRHRSDR